MKTLFSAAAFAVPTLAFGQIAAPVALDPIVVSAAKTPEPASKTLAAVTVITREDIERAQASDISDLLRFTAGLEIGRNGGPGQNTSVFVRGASSAQTLIMIDGVRIGTESFLGTQIQNISPQMIERIEIVKGPRSALYGSDAMGGVINIITKRPDSGISGDLSLRYGSYNTQDIAATAGYANALFSVGGSVQKIESEGFPSRVERDEDRGFDNLNYALNGALHLGKTTVSARHSQADVTNEYVGGSFSGFPLLSQDWTNRVSALAVETPLGPVISTLTGSLSYDRRDANQTNTPGLFDFDRVSRRSLEWENRYTTGSTTLIGGLQTQRSHIDSVLYEFNSRTSGNIEQNSVFGQVTTPIGASTTRMAARYTEHSRFGGHTTGNVEMGFPVTSNARITVAWGNAFSAPDLLSLLGAFGNPDLQPESSDTYELGWHYARANQQLSLALFNTRFDNLVGFDASFTPANIKNARNTGVEAHWKWQPSALYLQLDGTYQRPQDLDTNKALARRARAVLSGHVGYTYRGIDGRVEWLAQGQRRDSSFSNAELAGYGILNASLHLPVAKGLSLSLRGENLLDKTYELASRFRSPGASGYATLRYNY